MNRRDPPTSRSARLASCPSQAQVQSRREREETSGGPPAPHNSVDRTIVLNDVPDSPHQEEVFREAPRSPRAQARRPLPIFLDESVIVMEDTLPARRREVSLPAPVGVEDDQELIVIEDDTEEEDNVLIDDDSVVDDNNLRDGDDRE